MNQSQVYPCPLPLEHPPNCKHFLNLLDPNLWSIYPCLHFIFKILDHLYDCHSAILFQVDRLFPLHVFGLMDLMEHLLHISVFAFLLIYWAWDLFSAGWKVIVPLNYGVFPPWVGLDQCLVKGFLVGGNLCSGRWSWIFSFSRVVPCPLVGFVLSEGFLWPGAACLLMCSVVLLFC